MYDLDKKVWKVARSFTVMEDRFPFRGSVGIGKQIDLTSQCKWSNDPIDF